MTKSRIFSYVIAGIIILYGIFGTNLWPIFQELASSLIPNEDIQTDLTNFLKGRRLDKYDKWALGRYIIYYPTYLLLHLLLVNSIFWTSKYLTTVNLFFLGSIVFWITSSLILFLFKLEYLYQMAMSVTHTALNLPLILFVVEGGNILLSDINKMLKRD